MTVAPVQRPPDPPELPEGAAPRWPPWYSAVGFLVALSATLIAVGIVSVFTTGLEEGSHFGAPSAPLRGGW